MRSKNYKLKKRIAEEQNIPQVFSAILLEESSVGYYLWNGNNVDRWIRKEWIKKIWDEKKEIEKPKDHYIYHRKKKLKKVNKAIYIEGDLIKLTFKFSFDLLDKVRSLPGRKYYSQEKYWTVPIYPKTIHLLKEWGFELDERIREVLENRKRDKLKISRFKGELYPFQKDGVAFVEANNGKALIADDMGLGKTIQSIAWIQMHPELTPVLIVCPASLKLNWKKEIEKFTEGRDIEILSGVFPWEPTGDTLIINYDILTHWESTLSKTRPQVLIADECHYFKNPSARRTKSIMRLGRRIPHIITLSGTPILNRPIEAFNALKLIAPDLFPSYWKYAHRYCGAKHNGFGWDFSGASHTDELHHLLKSSVMIRRLKTDVLKELPEKIRSFIPIELKNKKEYESAEIDFVRFIYQTKGREAAKKIRNTSALSSIEGLKQLAVKGKIDQVIEWIKDFLQIEDKLVVFAIHRHVIDYLMGVFGDIAVKVDGSVSGKKRQEAIDRFQNDAKIKLFIGNIRAAGVGITLTASSTVVFIELPWTPGELIQAEDRVHRIGQRESVNIYYLLAVGTIEERIAGIIDNKRKVLDQVLDGKEPERDSLLRELLDQYKKEFKQDFEEEYDVQP